MDQYDQEIKAINTLIHNHHPILRARILHAMREGSNDGRLADALGVPLEQALRVLRMARTHETGMPDEA